MVGKQLEKFPNEGATSLGIEQNQLGHKFYTF